MVASMNQRVTGFVSSIRRLCGGLLVGAIWQFGACGDSEDPTATPAPGTAGNAGTMSELDAGGGAIPTPTGSEDGDPTSPEATPDAGLTTTCTPGETKPCQFEALCSGIATCARDGSAFGTCDCGALNADVVGIIGARCASDDDCAGGAFCSTASGNDFYGAGGPAGGYCTFSCTEDVDCTDRDPLSTCSPVGPDGTSICIRTCLSKAPEPGEAKCLNRPDVACESVVVQQIEQFTAEPQLGFCVPRCGSDEECPSGRVCHRQAGICADFPAPGAPVGSACSTSDDCDGRDCQDRVNGNGICTAPCVLGGLSGCGYGRNADVREAACVIPVAAAGNFSEGPGDLGFCLELCDVDADCQQAATGFVCRPLSAGLAGFLGRRGACSRGVATGE
jgi:hypothetical protein